MKGGIVKQDSRLKKQDSRLKKQDSRLKKQDSRLVKQDSNVSSNSSSTNYKDSGIEESVGAHQVVQDFPSLPSSDMVQPDFPSGGSGMLASEPQSCTRQHPQQPDNVKEGRS